MSRLVTASVVVAGFVLTASAHAQVSLVSRHSERRAYSGSISGTNYDITETFDGPGLWEGRQPQGGSYSHYAFNTTLGSTFQSNEYGESGVGSAWYQSTMTATYRLQSQGTLDLTLSANSILGPRERVPWNAGLRITSIETGAVVFDLYRDASYRIVDQFVVFWDQQQHRLLLDRGTYRIDAESVTNETVGGGGFTSGSGRLDFAAQWTAVPAPASFGLVAMGSMVMTRRRRAR
jgi:hypothetical protein